MNRMCRASATRSRGRQAGVVALCLALAASAVQAQTFNVISDGYPRELGAAAGNLPPGYALDWQGRVIYVGGGQPVGHPAAAQGPIYPAGYAQAPAPAPYPAPTQQAYYQPQAAFAQQQAQAGCSDPNGTLLGTLLGAVVGGMAGRSIGNGSGRTAATGMGVVAGAAVGSRMGDRCR
jgi:hypothetical protein